MLLQPVITAGTKVEDDQRKKKNKHVNIDIEQVF